MEPFGVLEGGHFLAVSLRQGRDALGFYLKATWQLSFYPAL